MATVTEIGPSIRARQKSTIMYLLGQQQDPVATFSLLPSDRAPQILPIPGESNQVGSATCKLLEGNLYSYPTTSICGNLKSEAKPNRFVKTPFHLASIQTG